MENQVLDNEQVEQTQIGYDEIAFVTGNDTERALRTKLDTIHILEPLSVLRIANC